MVMKYYVKLQAVEREKETVESRPYGDPDSVGITSLVVYVPLLMERSPRHQHSTVLFI